jgi:hypothetical protein
MKTLLLFLSFLFVLSFSAIAQKACTVVKFNGESFQCDEVIPGKTIVCKTKGQDKIKLNYTEVSYYIVKYKITVVEKGQKPQQIDTTRKCFVPEDGREFTVQIENDSVFLATAIKTINNTDFTDYFIYRKKDNTEALKIKKDKTAPDALKEYFGGSCPVFDKKLEEATPKFKKAAFPYDEFDTLIYQYRKNCKK